MKEPWRFYDYALETQKRRGFALSAKKMGSGFWWSRSPLVCWECVEHCGGLSYHNLACCTLTVVHDVFNDIYASIGWTLSAEGCTTDGEVEALND